MIEGEALLEMETSADGPGGVTDVITGGVVLLDGSGSLSVPVTTAELLSVPAAFAVTVMTTVAFALTASDPRLQMTVLVPLQLPWLAVTVCSVVPAGSASVTCTEVAVAGPPLCAVSV